MLRFILVPTYGWFGFHTIAFSSLVVLATISHFRAQFTDPGTMPKSFVRICCFAPVPLLVRAVITFPCIIDSNEPE